MVSLRSKRWVMLTIDRECGPAGVRSELTGRLALVVTGHLQRAVDQSERSPVLLHPDLHVLALLQLLAVEVPRDGRLGVARKVALEAGLHASLDALLATFLDELRRLLLVWKGKCLFS